MFEEVSGDFRRGGGVARRARKLHGHLLRAFPGSGLACLRALSSQSSNGSCQQQQHSSSSALQTSPPSLVCTPSKMAGIPVPFSDIAKPANDLLTKDFYHVQAGQ